MVELGNHQGRPPATNQNQPLEMYSSDTNQLHMQSLQEPWMNMDISNLENATGLLNGSGTNREGTDIVSTNTVTSKDILNLFNTQELLDIERAWDLELIASSNPLLQDVGLEKYLYCSTGEQVEQLNKNYFTIWGAPMDVDAVKLEDIFQVDEDDLIQGPTLAELNSNNEPSFFDLEFEEFKPEIKPSPAIMASQSKISIPFDAQNASESCATILDRKIKKEPVLPTLSHALSVPAVPTVSTGKSLPQQLVGAKCMSDVVIKQEVEEVEEPQKKQIHLGSLLGVRQRREASPVASTSTSSSLEKSQSMKIPPTRHRKDSTTDASLCSLSSLSSLSNDEGFGSQAEDSDAEDVASSDDESLTSESPETRFESSKVSKNTRKKKYFWQYNIQSKGPKGPRISLNTTSIDPHILGDALDPVFSSECMLEGVKHAGKARRGDGNDLTPNPRKLHNIGLELKSLNKMINDLAPVTNVPFNARPKTRKEKNKLASRACRLKKKAQHEANKLKLYGLQQEHKELMNLVIDAKNVVKKHISEWAVDKQSCVKSLEKLLKAGGEVLVAGHAAEFVNRVLDKVAQGQSNGGLHDL